jgi:uncharacterized membrane protein (UPF0136 family)
MIEVTKIYYLVFGLLTLIGGIMGYVKAKSLASIVAGSICGVLLLGAGVLLFMGKVNLALILGILVSVALAGQFVPKVMLNRAPIHALIMAVLSIIGVIFTLIAFTKK